MGSRSRAIRRPAGRRSWRLVVPAAVLLLCLLSALPGGISRAHPADMYTQRYVVLLSPEGLRLTWSISPGPLLAASTWHDADRDGDEHVSADEARAWAAGRLEQFTAAVNETIPVRLRLEAVEWPAALLPFELGDESIQIRLAAPWPPGLNAPVLLTLHSRFEEPISLNWFYLHGEGGLAFATPGQRNGLLQVEFALPGADVADDAYPLRAWDSGMPALPLAGGVEKPSAEPPASAILTGLIRVPELTPSFYTAALAVALLLGTLHALTPGHGKALVAAYLVGARGTMRHAVVLGSVVTLTHTGSVLAIGALTLAASRFFAPTALFPALEMISGLLIILIGVGMLRRRWRGLQAVRRRVLSQPPVLESNRRRIQINQPIPANVYNAALPGQKLSVSSIRWRALVALGVSGGLVPCPDAIVILLVAVAINRLLLGLSMIVSFSVGMALVLVIIGILVVRGRKTFEHTDAFSRLAPALSVLSAVIVLGLGIALTLSAGTRNVLLMGIPSGPEPRVGELSQPDAFDIERASVLYLAPDAEGRQQLHRAALRDGLPVLLSAEPFGVWDYALAPDGRTVAYAALREGMGSDLWALDLEGRERRRLLACPQANCFGAVWSPDGGRLIYERLDMLPDDPMFGITSLWWLDATSGETGPLLQDSRLPGAAPRWSPDGRWISYVSATNAGIQVYSLQTGQSITLPTRSSEPVIWDPTGRVFLLITESLRDGQYRYQMLRYDMASRQLSAFTTGHDADYRSATWSPDGARLAVVQDAQAGAPALGDQVWLVEAESGQARQLTQAGRLIHGRPAWSPDGRYLLLHRFALEQGWAEPAVLLVDTETGETRQVVAPGQWPAWLPD